MLDFFSQVQDICKIHIDDVLKDISETVLIELPDDHATSVHDLIDRNEVWSVITILFPSSKLKHEVYSICSSLFFHKVHFSKQLLLY